MNIPPADKIWRLMVFSVPDRMGGLMGGLMERLGFRATKKNAANWWRTYDPNNTGARAAAKAALEALTDAGLTSRRWDEVDRMDKTRPAASKPISTGHTNFARHNTATGNYRMRFKRR